MQPWLAVKTSQFPVWHDKWRTEKINFQILLGSRDVGRRRPVIRRRKASRAASSKKQQGFDWFLPNENNEMVKVCKNFMLSTIDINNDTLWDRINTIFEDEQSNRPGPSTSHKRSSKTKNDATSKQPKWTSKSNRNRGMAEFVTKGTESLLQIEF